MTFVQPAYIVGVTNGLLVRIVILACMKLSTRCNYRLNLLLSYGSHSVTKISVTPFRLDRHPIGPSTQKMTDLWGEGGN